MRKNIDRNIKQSIRGTKFRQHKRDFLNHKMI